MKTDSATEIRKALSRFPRWTQRYFTWQTGIAEQGEQRRHPWRVRTHVAALVVSWLVTLAFGTCAVELVFDAVLPAASATVPA